MNALIHLFELAEALVSREMLKAVSRGATSTQRSRGQRLGIIRQILTELRAKAVGTETTPGAAWDVVAEAYRDGAGRAANDVPSEVSTHLGGIHLQSAHELFAALTDSLDNAIAHVGRKANDALRKATLNELLVGQFAGQTRGETGKAIEENLRDRGASGFTDKAGREWGLAHYAQMAARTTAAEAQTTGTLNRLAENGFDLVRVSKHPHPEDVCSRYEGRVFSISGTSDKYPALQEAPPFHPFCRHVLSAHVEGLSDEG